MSRTLPPSREVIFDLDLVARLVPSLPEVILRLCVWTLIIKKKVEIEENEAMIDF